MRIRPRNLFYCYWLRPGFINPMTGVCEKPYYCEALNRAAQQLRQ